MCRAGTHKKLIMRTRDKICLGIALGLLILGLIGVTEPAQVLLRGTAPPNETPFQADDRYMGAGFAPIVCCMIPSLLLFLYVGVSLLWKRFRGKLANHS
jgi:hypothetical protein